MNHVQRRLPRSGRYALYAFAAFALVTLAALAYFAATFDAKSYVPRLADIVREKTGRTLAVNGDVRMSFWPDIAIDTGPMTLSERDGENVFISIGAARLQVEIAPLLSRRIIVEGLEIRGAHVNIVRDKEGRLNVDDLLGREGPPAEFDIGRVNVRDSSLTFSDLGSGERFDLSAIALATGRLTKAVPTNISLAFDAAKAGAAWRMKVALKSDLVLDLDRETTRLERITLTGSGASGEDRIDLTMSAARAESVPARITIETLETNAKATGRAGATLVKLSAPRFERTEGIYRAAPVSCDVEIVRGDTTLRIATTAALDGDTKQKRVVLSELRADIAAAGPRLPQGKLAATASGSALVDLGKEGVHLKLAGETGGSRLSAAIDAAGFAAPVYAFKIDVDRIDLDRYGSKAPARPEKAEDLLQPLADVPATGTLHVGSLKAGDVVAKNVTVVLR